MRLKRHADGIRRDLLKSIYACGSGHPGGALSAADLLTYVWLEILRVEERDPAHAGRDRFILSKGHACPALYALAAHSGLIPRDSLATLRRLDSALQGHPSVIETPWVETSTGSLGQGFSVAVGTALGQRLRGGDARTYVMLGDGELQEGEVWEGAMFAGHHRLDNLCGILDYNKMQSDDLNENVMGLEPLRAKWESFRWHVIEIDGHDFSRMEQAFRAAKEHGGAPTLIIAHTVKGKGVSFMEGSPLWHGSVKLRPEELRRALEDLGASPGEVAEALPQPVASGQAAAVFSPSLVGTTGDSLREAFGKALVKLAGRYPEFLVLDADVAGGTGTHHFRKGFPGRFIQFGIAEQNMFAAAGGLAAMGFVPIATTFAVFALRTLEQVRLSIAYAGRNVKIVASHPGLDVGPDGASAQALEDLAAFRAIPGMTVISPADPLETEQATEAILNHVGPVYMRTGRSPARRILPPDHRFEIGKGTILRPGSDVTLAACGVEVARSLDAAEILAGEGISARVVNMSTIKPLDGDLLLRCARETGCLVTAEDHSVIGGLGSAVAEFLAERHPCPVEFVGVRDVFGTSGEPDELAERYRLTGPHIAEAARKALDRKRKGGRN